jgi:hypothetical protein
MAEKLNAAVGPYGFVPSPEPPFSSPTAAEGDLAK